MNYWIDLFTGTTWREFRDAGAVLTGFNKRATKTVSRIQAGDVLLCYLTGVKRWVGALEVLGPSNDGAQVWSEAEFPVRLAVRPIVLLDPEIGLPMEQLEGKVEFYRNALDRGKYQGIVRTSPRGLAVTDGDFILSMLQAAERSPVSRPVDAKQLARKVLFSAESKRSGKSVETHVTVPEIDDEQSRSDNEQNELLTSAQPSKHTEIQYELLRLGSEMGLDIWVARNDRSRCWQGTALGSLPRMASTLPTQFNNATNRTIELIDVLWLKGNAIVAAFEVESTTSIYSGLLRMSDLISLQPNLEIRLFLVAPDERQDKVETEILRPTFQLRDRPLSEICGFLPFSTLLEKANGIRQLGLASSLKPDFLDKTAIYFGTDNNE